VARRLIYAQEARDDLEAARGWLTQPGSGPAARRKLAAIRADIRRLQQHPCLWPAGDHPSVRELPAAGGYHVFYKVEPDTGREVWFGFLWPFRNEGEARLLSVISQEPAVLAPGFGAARASRRARRLSPSRRRDSWA